MLRLDTIAPNTGAKKSRKRIGRGNGSGHGTFCTRGVKGQKARSGKKLRPGFEGGQTPLISRMPKLRGFKNPNRQENQVVSLAQLNRFNEGEHLTKAMLKKAGIIQSVYMPVKILGTGTLEKKLTVHADHASASAKDALSKAGGSIESSHA